MHRAILAYASDMSLLGTSMLPHGVNWMTHKLQTASLDHALWLHEPFRADEWLLYACDSPWAGHARGFNRGRIFTPRRPAGRQRDAGRADPDARVAGRQAAVLPNSCRVTGWLDDSPPSTTIAWPLT